jgi:2,4-dienoyl-CoA reductase-like NADH-dependent reductase (Old Yellow Enzyme family)
MAKLNEPITIRNITIKNRIAMAPMMTFSFHGDNGSFYGHEHIEHYTERAKGGAGLIILQATSVSGALNGEKKWSEYNREVLKKIANNGHGYGSTMIMQLSCGDRDINEMTEAEIHSMQKEIVQASANACDLGYDGVEYHFAHGYTLCKFLDGCYNQRTDSYGGTVENRTRVLCEILPEIRKNTRENFILCVRMGAYCPELKDGIEAAQTFEKAGIDLLSISFGMKIPEGPAPEGFPCSHMTYSGCLIKKEVHVPVIVVNEIRTSEQVRYLIENDYADFAGIGRAMLADPCFANHVMEDGPLNKCFACKTCMWYSDHSKCPAGKKRELGR